VAGPSLRRLIPEQWSDPGVYRGLTAEDLSLFRERFLNFRCGVIVMDANEKIDAFLKRMLYMIANYTTTAAALTLVAGEGLAHFAKLYITLSLNFLSLPLAALSNYFSGVSLAEWYIVVVVWLSSLVVLGGCEPGR